MIEIREDIISKRKVVINEIRELRPSSLILKLENKTNSCVFCKGNENKTPEEISRYGTKDWKIRVFPNKYPVFENNSEVIVLTPKHDITPFNFSIKKWHEIFNMYIERIKDNIKKEKTKYVLLLHNHGGASGASIYHSHSQLINFPIIPNIINQESKSCSKELCCEMVKRESKSKRLVYSNNDFIIFTNYASRFPYETHIYPRKHFKSITELKSENIYSLSEAMFSLMKSYNKLFKDLSFNFVIHEKPKGKNYHFHIEFYPRLKIDAGVEYGTNISINGVSPETAAKNLKGALK